MVYADHEDLTTKALERIYEDEQYRLGRMEDELTPLKREYSRLFDMIVDLKKELKNMSNELETRTDRKKEW